MPTFRKQALISIRPIAVHEWKKYRDTRLRALKDSPDAFGSTWEREVLLTDDSWSTRIATAAKSRNNGAFFAVNGEQVYGLIWAQISEKESSVARLYQMWVDPEARGLGVGRSLLTQALAWAKKNGVRRVQLGVTVADSPALKLYTSQGFLSVGTAEPLREGSGLMAQTMVLELGH